MFSPKFLEDLSSRLAKVLPLAEELRDDARTRIEQLLKNSFAGLDLLSREEFDAQRQALQRAEHRIEELEQTLTTLGEKLQQLEQPSAGN
ncbi:MAG: accessory factor UbiK family protein [Pseudohongiellaceae bacterium]